MNEIAYHILFPNCLLRMSQKILTSLLNQILPKTLFSCGTTMISMTCYIPSTQSSFIIEFCLLDPPIPRMDPWPSIAWANISRVYWVLGFPRLLGTVDTAPYKPLTWDYSAGSDTDAPPVWFGNFIPLHRDNYLIFPRIPPPFGPNLRREQGCTECEVYRK